MDIQNSDVKDTKDTKQGVPEMPDDLQSGVLQDAVFGDITEDGPNYRSVSLYLSD